MAHYIHYHARHVRVKPAKDVPQDPWYATYQTQDAGFRKPEYHITRRRSAPASLIGNGDCIWLFSQIKSRWGDLPISLDAKIVVCQREDLRRSPEKSAAIYRYNACTGSKWFTLFDATGVLPSLWTVTQGGKVSRLLSKADQHPGNAMRSLRKLVDAEPLVLLEKCLEDRIDNFISYRLTDGTQAAFSHCRHLMSQGQSVWWDRWSLPRRLVERREDISTPALDQAIFSMIGKIRPIVWGIETKDYGVPECYGARERRFAEELGLYRSVPVERTARAV